MSLDSPGKESLAAVLWSRCERKNSQTKKSKTSELSPASANGALSEMTPTKNNLIWIDYPNQ